MKKDKVTAFAPATVANVAVGFDILGFALEGLGETATVEKIENSTDVIVEPIEGYPNLPLDPLKNTSTAGLVQLIEDQKLKFGFRVSLQKTIPVGSGLGGSSTSAVAALIAAQSFLKKKLTAEKLVHYALIGESVASGSRHADNIAPCLQGGLVYVQSDPVVRAHAIRTPASLRCVLLLPELTIQTKDSRAALKPEVPLKAMVQQTSHLTGFLLGCLKNDFHLIRESLKDVVIEPQRARMIPGFSDIQSSALKAGALGCSISGSGPALFALVANPQAATRVRKAMLAAAQTSGLQIRNHWVSSLSKKGAHLIGKRK